MASAGRRRGLKLWFWKQEWRKVDATNAADSKVVGLTGVSLEHTELLGLQ